MTGLTGSGAVTVSVFVTLSAFSALNVNTYTPASLIVTGLPLSIVSPLAACPSFVYVTVTAAPSVALYVMVTDSPALISVLSNFAVITGLTGSGAVTVSVFVSLSAFSALNVNTYTPASLIVTGSPLSIVSPLAACPSFVYVTVTAAPSVALYVMVTDSPAMICVLSSSAVMTGLTGSGAVTVSVFVTLSAFSALNVNTYTPASSGVNVVPVKVTDAPPSLLYVTEILPLLAE